MSVFTSNRVDAPTNMEQYTDQRVRTGALVPVPVEEQGVLEQKQRPERVQRASTAKTRTASHLFSLVPPLLFALLLLACWYVVTAYLHVSSLFLPAPADVFSSLADGFTSGLYLSNAWATIQESLGGFLLALLIALPLGYGLAKFRLLAITVHPYMAAGQAIPAIVIAPLLILWLGYGLLTYIVISALVVFFPLVINTILGLQTIDHEVTDAARVSGAGRWELLKTIEFPLALPSILAAVRTCLTLSIVGAVVSEFVIGSDQGLGGLLLQAKNQYNMPFMFATVGVLALLAALYYGIGWGLTKLSEAVY